MMDFKQLQQFAQSVGYKGGLEKFPDFLMSRPDIQSKMAASMAKPQKKPGNALPNVTQQNQQGMVGRKGIRSFADGGYVVGEYNDKGIAPVNTPSGAQYTNDESPTGSRWTSSNDMNYVNSGNTDTGTTDETDETAGDNGDPASDSGTTEETPPPKTNAETATDTVKGIYDEIAGDASQTAQDLLDGKIPDGATVDDPAHITSEDQHVLDKEDYTVDPNDPNTQASANLPNLPGDMAGTTIETSSSQPGVEDAINKYGGAAQGTVTKTVSQNRTVDAQTMDPNQLAQLGLDAPQMDENVGQIDPNKYVRELQSGELVSGNAVNQAKVDQLIAGITAVTGDPPEAATVRGQLAKLMLDFELNDGVPPWASGAMRSALSMMAERGLSASSMAGQAITQAAMESATQIAYADAQTYSIFERENLDRRQQTIFMAAQQRAAFMQQEFDQEFQTRVINAAKISSIADTNHNTAVQIALENSRAAQTVTIANLNVKSAKVLSDAAAMTSIQRDNLANMMTAEMTTEQLRQQAEIANAQNFLQMDLANLSARQQMKAIGLQSVVQSILSDTAIKNATDQFNATSEDTMKRFIENLRSNVEIARSTIEADISKFNANMYSARELFNNSNSIAIDSANAIWEQSVTTGNTAIDNAFAKFNAEVFSGLFSLGFSGALQETRDLMSYAWQSSEAAEGRDFTKGENQLNREQQMALTIMSQVFQKQLYEMGIDFAEGSAIGGFLGDLTIELIKNPKILEKGVRLVGDGIDFLLGGG